MNSVNLAIRFLLEVTTLIALGVAGWNLSEDLPGFVFAAALPVTAATFWGVFAVPNDPSRSGSAPIPIAGFLRLLLEFLFFASGVWSLVTLDQIISAWIFLVIVLLHYVASYERVLWLIRQ